jgi:hypothetical protein
LYPTRSPASANKARVSGCSIVAEALSRVKTAKISLSEQGVVAIWQKAVKAPTLLKLMRQSEEEENSSEVERPTPDASGDCNGWSSNDAFENEFLREVERLQALTDLLRNAPEETESDKAPVNGS